MPYSPKIARCQHIKVNGTQCGSPAVRRNQFCFFHKRWREQHVTINPAKKLTKASLDLPVLEDANSIQVALMQVMQLLLAGQIEHKTASLLLYGLQTASLNLRTASFEPSRKETVVIRPQLGRSHAAGRKCLEPRRIRRRDRNPGGRRRDSSGRAGSAGIRRSKRKCGSPPPMPCRSSKAGS